ncbi:MAG: 50S ribosomal protein L11 [Rhodopirellula sp.]|nr:50S ribosomal protein L11 [Rhodopirellula sp.]
MAKQVTAKVKVQIPAGQATPAPPVGTALGPHGVNIGQFVQGFNERTRELNGTIVPVVITIYNDRSFEFDVRSPPAAVLLKQYAQVAKGASNPRTDRVGSVTRDQILEIARIKKDDLNTKDEAQACRIIAGTARSMGVEVTG